MNTIPIRPPPLPRPAAKRFVQKAFRIGVPMRKALSVAIIGILIALLLPAVQAAREAARRSQCSNNMKQIGLALQNYHDRSKCFPPIAIHGRGPAGNPWPAYHHTWLTMLLPFMEQGPLYQSIDFRLPAMSAYTPPNAVGQAVISTVVNGLLCPSDPFFGRDVSKTRNLAITNYVGVMGWHWWENCQNCPDANVMPGNNTNIFAPPRTSTFADITDGSSNTIVVSERLSKGWSPTGNNGQPGPRPDWIVCAAFVYMGPYGYCWEMNPPGWCQRPDGSAQAPGWLMAYDGSQPYVMAPLCITAHGLNWEWGAPSQIHPGIVQGALADGSVRGYSVTIDYSTWNRIHAMQSNATKSQW
jgi:hypothetical protein